MKIILIFANWKSKKFFVNLLEIFFILFCMIILLNFFNVYLNFITNLNLRLNTHFKFIYLL